jgi:hypothetical protein
MEYIYSSIVNKLADIVIPEPANQLEMEAHCRRSISALENAKEHIEEILKVMRHRLREWGQ